MRPSKTMWFLELAQVTAKRSTCLRRQVGCLLVNARGQVLATGYNGVARGLPHCNEPTADLTKVARHLKMAELTPAQLEEVFPHACPAALAPSGTRLEGCEAIHAEQNALLQCPDSWAIAQAFVTVSPCVTCVKLLLNTSCQEVVFNEPYAHDAAARALWVRAGRHWIPARVTAG